MCKFQKLIEPFFDKGKQHKEAFTRSVALRKLMLSKLSC